MPSKYPPRFRTITSVLDTSISRSVPQLADEYLLVEAPVQRIRLDALKQRIFEFRKTDPIFRCPHCNWPLFIAQSPYDPHHYIFKHFGGNPKKDCPWFHERAGNLRRLNAIRFGPEGESDTHRKMVSAIFHSVSVDDRFEAPELRRAAKNKITSDPHKFPDVQTVFFGRRIAFEAQWSRQYCQVVADRERFYRENEWWIAWIFHNFELGSHLFANIWTGNRYNALELDNVTIARTIETHRFHLKAHWFEYDVRPDENNQGAAKVVPVHRSDLIDIGDLQWDRTSTKPYFHDSFALELAARKTTFDMGLFWKALGCRTPRADNDVLPERHRFLERLLSKAPLREKRTPKGADAVGLIPVIQALRSMETGTVIGYRFKNPVEYANRVLDDYPWAFEAVIRMVAREYGDRYETPFRKAAQAQENPECLLIEQRDFAPFYGLMDMLFELNLTDRWWGNRTTTNIGGESL